MAQYFNFGDEVKIKDESSEIIYIVTGIYCRNDGSWCAKLKHPKGWFFGEEFDNIYRSEQNGNNLQIFNLD